MESILDNLLVNNNLIANLNGIHYLNDYRKTDSTQFLQSISFFC